MGSKGSNTTSTQTAQNQTYTPAGQNYMTDALNRAQTVSNLPFNTPEAPVAGFSQDQQSAFNTIDNSQGMAQPYINQAQGYFNQSANPDAAQAFYNPMAANVTSQLQNVFGQQNVQNNASLVNAAGGVGADRIAVGQGNLANQQGLAAGQTYANLWQQAQQNATGALQGAGYGTAALGSQAQNAALQGAQAQLGSGGLQQQLSQAQLNAPYQQQLAQSAFPYQQGQYLAGITAALAGGLGGSSVGNGNSFSTSQYNPSPLATAIGLGTAGAGAAGGLLNYDGGGTVMPFAYGGGAFAYGGGADDAADYGYGDQDQQQDAQDRPIDVAPKEEIPHEKLGQLLPYMPSMNLNPQSQQSGSSSGKGSGVSDFTSLLKAGAGLAALFKDGGVTNPFAHAKHYDGGGGDGGDGGGDGGDGGGVGGSDGSDGGIGGGTPGSIGNADDGGMGGDAAAAGVAGAQAGIASGLGNLGDDASIGMGFSPGSMTADGMGFGVPGIGSPSGIGDNNGIAGFGPGSISGPNGDDGVGFGLGVDGATASPGIPGVPGVPGIPGEGYGAPATPSALNAVGFSQPSLSPVAQNAVEAQVNDAIPTGLSNQTSTVAQTSPGFTAPTVDGEFGALAESQAAPGVAAATTAAPSPMSESPQANPQDAPQEESPQTMAMPFATPEVSTAPMAGQTSPAGGGPGGQAAGAGAVGSTPGVGQSASGNSGGMGSLTSLLPILENKVMPTPGSPKKRGGGLLGYDDGGDVGDDSTLSDDTGNDAGSFDQAAPLGDVGHAYRALDTMGFRTNPRAGEQPPAPSVSPTLVNQVKQFEGYSPTAKWDHQQFSNGYGTKASSPNEVIDPNTANQRLQAALGTAQTQVNRFVPDAPSNVREALASFTHNLGPGWMSNGSQLSAAVKGGDYSKAAQILQQYNHVRDDNGQLVTSPGLANRRAAEAAMMLGKQQQQQGNGNGMQGAPGVQAILKAIQGPQRMTAQSAAPFQNAPFSSATANPSSGPSGPFFGAGLPEWASMPFANANGMPQASAPAKQGLLAGDAGQGQGQGQGEEGEGDDASQADDEGHEVPPRGVLGADRAAQPFSPQADHAGPFGSSNAQQQQRSSGEPALNKRFHDFLGSPWGALMAGGLSLASGHPFAEGLQFAQKQMGVDQGARKLEQEAQFHQDQMARLDRPYKEMTAAEKQQVEAKQELQRFQMSKPVPGPQSYDQYGMPRRDIMVPEKGPDGNWNWKQVSPQSEQAPPQQPNYRVPGPQGGQQQQPQGGQQGTAAPMEANADDGVIPQNARMVSGGAQDYTHDAPTIEKGMDVPEPQAVGDRSAGALKRDAENYVQTGKLPSVRGTRGAVAINDRNYRDAVQNYGDALLSSRGITSQQSADMWRSAPGMLRFVLGADGRSTVALGTAVRHLDTLKQYADAWKAGDTQTINRLRSVISREFGSSAATNLETAGRIVGPEIIKAIGVAGAGTTEERGAAQSGFATSRSPEQVTGAIDVTQRLLGGQLEGKRRQAAAAGVDEAHFKNLIGDRPYELLSNLGKGEQGSANASGGQKPKPSQTDIDYAKAHPEVRDRFIKRFGIEP